MADQYNHLSHDVVPYCAGTLRVGSYSTAANVSARYRNYILHKCVVNELGKHFYFKGYCLQNINVWELQTKLQLYDTVETVYDYFIFTRLRYLRLCINPVR